ncbi:MAG: hypothetical protein AUJ98_00510 [Bacteroidetes bacterium CG2_30_33_31]|nr:MAG: hypothetical protein AUJ98_00510 [Bacteroidetes bacterium CG2_30_33_31]
MLTIFDNINIEEIEDYLYSKEKCLKFVADEKWRAGYTCQKCGNGNYCSGKKPYSRRCTRCKYEESATANTIFHRCRLDLPTAFRLAHLICSNREISTAKLAEEMKLRPMTCWNFKKKITSCIDLRTDVSESRKIELKEIILGKGK